MLVASKALKILCEFCMHDKRDGGSVVMMVIATVTKYRQRCAHDIRQKMEFKITMSPLPLFT